MIFWPQFFEKAVEPDLTVTVPNNKNGNTDTFTGDKPQKYFEIKLFWTEWKNGKWLPKKLGDTTIKTIHQDVANSSTVILDKKSYFFRASITDDGSLFVYPTGHLIKAGGTVRDYYYHGGFIFEGNAKQPYYINNEDLATRLMPSVVKGKWHNNKFLVKIGLIAFHNIIISNI